MSDIGERLYRLREEMKKNGITMYYIPSDDFHGSEYVSGYFKSREYISGFTGSAGEVIVTQDAVNSIMLGTMHGSGRTADISYRRKSSSPARNIPSTVQASQASPG